MTSAAASDYGGTRDANLRYYRNKQVIKVDSFLVYWNYTTAARLLHVRVPARVCVRVHIMHFHIRTRLPHVYVYARTQTYVGRIQTGYVIKNVNVCSWRAVRNPLIRLSSPRLADINMQ